MDEHRDTPPIISDLTGERAMQLSNTLIRLTFDDQHGSLTGIEDLRTGVQHLHDHSVARLFRLILPDEARWTGQYADSHQQPISPVMVVHGHTLTLCFPEIVSPHGTSLGVQVTVTITLPDDADEARFTIQVVNDGPFLLHEVWFPWIGGWRGYAGQGHDRMHIGYHPPIDPWTIREHDGYTLCAAHRRRCYSGLALPLLDLSGEGIGLSNNFYPVTPQQSGIMVDDANSRAGAPQPTWSWVHYPYLGAGQHWQSDPVGLAPHQDDWHATADRLRAWVATWWQAPETPARLRSSIGYQNVQFRDFEGHDLRPLSDLPRLADHGLRHGVHDFCVWDVMANIYSRPDRGGFFEDTPERVAELRTALHHARQLGVQVSTLINARLVTMKNSLGPQLAGWAVKSLYGAPVHESWPVRTHTAAFNNVALDEDGLLLCQCHPDFQHWAQHLFEQAMDLGFTATFIDQPFGYQKCFAPDHGHPVPEDTEAGACQWVAATAHALKRTYPDCYLIGEVPDIWNTQYCDLWWHWPWSSLAPEVWRYVMPDSLQSWVIDAYEHEDQVNRAFVLGFLLSINVHGLEGTLEDVPPFAARIRQLANLRAAIAAFTVHGRFCDHQGLTIVADTEVTVAVYETASAIGIILGDTSYTRNGGDVALTFDSHHYGIPIVDQTPIYHLDGSVAMLTWAGSGNCYTAHVPLAPGEVFAIRIAREHNVGVPAP